MADCGRPSRRRAARTSASVGSAGRSVKTPSWSGRSLSLERSGPWTAHSPQGVKPWPRPCAVRAPGGHLEARSVGHRPHPHRDPGRRKRDLRRRLRTGHRYTDERTGRRGQDDRPRHLPPDRPAARHHQRPHHVQRIRPPLHRTPPPRAHDLRERGHALPGAAAALDTVAAMDDVVQSIVTGNIRAVAKTKIQVFGLDTYIQFPYGGYGDDHDDRADLVRTAIARTRAAKGAHVALTDVLLIGDTPADVAAARAAGVPVLAVATGRTSATELAEAGATTTINDLHDAAPLHDLLR
ncbi:HAD hydrolase-like protein [Streptomyces sp. NPDC058542]|uniref:HAD hydrolase-like protein n=1 Tax=Streptomyces sp. NPDC058542 TaxID=3346543 RepID=UPI0036540321